MSDQAEMTDELAPPAEVEEAAHPRPLPPEVAARREAALKHVRRYGDPVLKTRAMAITRFDDELRQEVARMGRLMDEALGIGLAAPQVGISHRLLVYRVVQGGPLGVLINPEVAWASKEDEWMEEGCLSLPAVHVEVERPIHVRVTAHDQHGEQLTVEASGLEARVIQHEMDHLDGVLILDRTPRGQRKEAMRALRAALADDAPGVRVAYLGTSAFAAGILGRLAESTHDVVAVVTRPDRPAGRGRRLAAPPVADAARALGLPLAQPADVNAEDARTQIAAAAPGVLVVCAFGALIKEPLLSDRPVLNVHPSLLPRWRGAAPVERAIMAGDAETGVCIMRLTAGLDTGPVCARGVEPIAPEDTYGSLAPRLERLAGDLLLGALDAGPDGWAWEEQPEDGVTYAEKIGPADRTLDPAAPVVEQERVVRALHPHIGARLALPDGTHLGVGRARVAEDGTLELLEVQPPGGRPMGYAEYLRGREAR